MGVERRVKLFKNGRSQAVRIPREFELPGVDAVMRKEGEKLIIEPAPRNAVALGCFVVTGNAREFTRIEGLAFENWLL